MALTRVTSGGIAEGINLRFTSGTLTNPSISFQNDTSTGIYKSGTNTFNLISNGSSKLQISSSGVTSSGDLISQIFKAQNGTSSAPSFSFVNDVNSGIYRDTSDTGIWKLVANSLPIVTIHKTNGFSVESNIPSSFGGTLTTTGDTTFNSNVTLVGSNAVNTEFFKIKNSAFTDTFIVDTFNGNTTISGTLSATGNTTLSGTLTTTGNTTLSGTLTTTGNATFNSNVTLVGSNTVNTEFFKIADGNSVDKFVVDSFNGNTTISGSAFVPDGTVSSPSISTTGDTNTGIFFPAADTIAFAEGGVEAMRIDNIGNVGIGTTTPAVPIHVVRESATTNAVTQALRIDSQSSGTPANGIGVGIQFATETTPNNTEIGATIEAIVTDITNASEDFDLSFKVMQNGASATEQMRISSTGSIFVPAGTATNPSVSLSTDSNTGIYFPSADTMGFVEGGTGYQMGYRNVPSAGADKTISYTLQLSDRGKLVTIGTSGGITVPANVFSAGDIIYIYNNTANPFTITRGTDPSVPATLAELYQSGIDSDVSSIAVATRTMGAIQYVSALRAVFFSGSQDNTTFQVEYVIVAGGGGGGQGGGGAGGYIAGKNSGTVDGINYGSAENQGGGIPAEKPIYLKKGVAYNVAIGAGGPAQTSLEPDSGNGVNTYFHNLVAIGGGGGKAGTSLLVLNTATRIQQVTTIAGGSNGGGFAGLVRSFARQGNLGGGGIQPNSAYGANGGGGASAAGTSSDATSITGYQNGKAGGAGLTTTLTGSETLAGGGGGGGGNLNGSTGGTGGTGGGGPGGGYSGTGTAGSVNTGGGGGGKGYAGGSATGTGGSGVILLRIPNTVTATSSTSGSPPTSDLTITESTTIVDNITFKTLKITAGIGTITFN